MHEFIWIVIMVGASLCLTLELRLQCFTQTALIAVEFDIKLTEPSFVIVSHYFHRSKVVTKQGFISVLKIMYMHQILGEPAPYFKIFSK